MGADPSPTDDPGQPRLPGIVPIRVDLASWAAVEAGFLAGSRAPSTVRTYRTHLVDWRGWCAREGLDPLAGVDRTQAGRYLADLAERGLGRSTIRDRLKVVRLAYAWAVDEAVLDRNPFARHTAPRQLKKIKRALTPGELSAFLTAAAGAGAVWHGLFRTLYVLGCRINELLAVDVEDLVVDELRYLNHKSQREEQKPLDASTVALLDAYLAGRRTGPLFRAGGRRVRDHQARYRARAIADAAGIARPSEIHPHTFRRTHATLLGDQGADLLVIQDSLGHSSPTTTRQYDANRARFRAEHAEALAALVDEPTES